MHVCLHHDIMSVLSSSLATTALFLFLVCRVTTKNTIPAKRHREESAPGHPTTLRLNLHRTDAARLPQNNTTPPRMLAVATGPMWPRLAGAM